MRHPEDISEEEYIQFSAEGNMGLSGSQPGMQGSGETPLWMRRPEDISEEEYVNFHEQISSEKQARPPAFVDLHVWICMANNLFCVCAVMRSYPSFIVLHC